MIVAILVVALAVTVAKQRNQSENSCENKPVSNTQTTIKPNQSAEEFISTNGQPFPYHDIRLPKNIVPVSYNIYLHPNITESNFTGSVTIICDVKKSTDFVVFHMKNLTIEMISVTRAGAGDNAEAYGGGRWLEYTKNEQIYVALDKTIPDNTQVNPNACLDQFI